MPYQKKKGNGAECDVGGGASSTPALKHPPVSKVQPNDEKHAFNLNLVSELAPLQLGKAHARALLPNFDDMSGEEQVVEVITQETTRLFKRCEKRLQMLSQGTEDAKVRRRKARLDIRVDPPRVESTPLVFSTPS